jgi:probable F420-dependent oxidoreductase
MKLGLALFATDRTRDIRDVARAAEDAGFESIFVAEHTHIPTSRETPYPMGGELPEEYSHTLDPFVTLTAAAAVTENLRVGTGICLVTERDPILLAKEVASLDYFSSGRFLFGIGVGWNAEELADHGVAFGERWDVIRDRTKLMQALWSNDVASYSSAHASVSESWQWPKPKQSPMEVMFGGGGPRAMKHAVDYCTSWLPMPMPEKFGDRMAKLREIADEAGKPVPRVTVQGVRPDAGVIAHYEEHGVERCILMLSAKQDPIETIKGWQGLVTT